MGVLLGCLVAHWWLARQAGNPWLVPDVTLVGLLYVVARSPRRWFAATLVTLVPLSLFAARHPVPVSVAWVGWAVTVRRLSVSMEWDRVAWWAASAAIGAAGLQGVAVWLDGSWPPMTGVWLLGHALLTAAVVPGLWMLTDWTGRRRRVPAR